MMLELFAQAGKKVIVNNPNAAPPPDPAAAAAAAGTALVMVVVYVVAIIVAIVFQILFLMALSKCLKQISPRNRTMEPGQVWLNLIPLFNYVWMFMTVFKIAESLEKEFRSRGRPQEGDYGKTLGLIGCISLFVCGCASPIIGIIYWVKIAGYTKLLQSSKGRSKRVVEEDEDEEDERPRPKKRRPRDEDEDDDE
jgi:heme/copper-type cytochrome/quinol oxidase subunit 2